MGGALLSRYRNFHSKLYLEVNSPLASCTTGMSRSSWGLIRRAVQTNTVWSSHTSIAEAAVALAKCLEAWELAPLRVDILSSSEAVIETRWSSMNSIQVFSILESKIYRSFALRLTWQAMIIAATFGIGTWTLWPFGKISWQFDKFIVMLTRFFFSSTFVQMNE